MWPRVVTDGSPHHEAWGGVCMVVGECTPEEDAHQVCHIRLHQSLAYRQNLLSSLKTTGRQSTLSRHQSICAWRCGGVIGSMASHMWSESCCKQTVPNGPWWHSRCNMCPDFFPGCCSGGHCCSHIVSIFTCICTLCPSRYGNVPQTTVTHHQYLVPNMCNNPSICPSSFLQAYTVTSFKWLKLFNRSTYSMVGHGCPLEWMLQTLFTYERTTITACRAKTGGAKTDLLSANCSPLTVTNESLTLQPLTMLFRHG